MPRPVNTEYAAISGLADLAQLDTKAATTLLDEIGTQPEDFGDSRLSALWSVMAAMIRDGRAPDFYAVEPKVPGFPRPLLSELLVPESSGDPRSPMAVVRENGQRRRISSVLSAALKTIADQGVSVSEALSAAQGALNAFSLGGGAAKTLDAEVFPFLDVLEEAYAGRREPVLPTGIEGLDALIGGLQPTLTIVGALPGVGKSALLGGIVRNLAGRGVRVGVFSLEDERGWLVKRIASEASGVPLFVLQNRRPTRGQMEAVNSCMDKVFNSLRHVVVDDRPGLTPREVVASARQMLAQQEVKAILVDHLGELRLERSERHDLDIADALRELRSLAKSHRVPVVVACHLRRREGLGVDAEPKLTDFAFSAAIERMARVALGLSKVADEPDSLRVSVLKQTNGISGVSTTLRLTAHAGLVANVEAAGTRQAINKLYGASDE